MQELAFYYRMTIGLVVDPYGEQSPSGLGRAVFEMAKAIIESDHGNAYTLYTKKRPLQGPAIGGSWELKSLNTRSVFMSLGSGISRTHGLYIFFSPIIPLFFFPKKSIVVVHDFAYLKSRRSVASFLLYLAHWLSLRKATKIVAISQDAKESVVKNFGIPPGRIEVIYSGYVEVSSAPEPMEVPDKFFLFVGVLKERKNVLGLIEAFAFFAKNHPDYYLLVAGKKEGAYYQKVARRREELRLGERVRFLGYVSDGELSYLYHKAYAFVFPSLLEGFGMPVLEAMSVGLPVITSNTGALAEVAGDATLLVDPHDSQNIARGMQELVDKPGLRDELVRKGSLRVKEFSWAKTAAQFHALIQKLS